MKNGDFPMKMAIEIVVHLGVDTHAFHFDP